MWTDAAIVFIGNLLARGLGFAFPLALAYVAGRADFALVYFFINSGFFVGEVVLTGFPAATTRELAAERETDERARWVIGGVLGGIPLLIVSVIVGEFLSALAGAPPLLMAAVVIGLTVDAYYFAVLRGLQRYALLMAYRVSANAAQLVLLGLVVGLGWLSVPVAVGVYSFVYLLPILVIEIGYSPLSGVLRAGMVGVSRSDLVRLSRFALPALVSGLAYGALLGLDVYLVRLLAPNALADYGAARTLALPMMMVPYAIGVVLMPGVASAPPGERHRMLARAMLVSVAVGLLLSLLYILLDRTVVYVLLPTSYHRAIEPLHTLAPAIAILGAYSVLSQWWFGSGRPVLPAVSLVIGALVTVAGHIIWTAPMGATGAGIAIGVGALSASAVLGIATVVDWRRATGHARARGT